MAVCKRSSVVLLAPLPSPISKKERWENEPLQPLPTEVGLNRDKVNLGETLFNDPRLSHDNSVSCASCHNLALGGTDQAARSTGNNGRTGEINAPTVFNAAYNFKQFWDGRATTLEEQIDGPVHAPAEMASDWNEIVAKLSDVPEYSTAFASLYGNGLTDENVRDAIATFERSLTTPNSRFDQFLSGDQEALTAEEREGYRTFKSIGCASCHQGVNIGGNLFQTFGVMGHYFADRGNITRADLGRFNVTGQEVDRYVFKVPGLRNVARTFPYFHDGSAKTLEEAVTVMSKYQLGRKLSPDEIDLIVKFLKTLDGEYIRQVRP